MQICLSPLVALHMPCHSQADRRYHLGKEPSQYRNHPLNSVLGHLPSREPKQNRRLRCGCWVKSRRVLPENFHQCAEYLEIHTLIYRPRTMAETMPREGRAGTNGSIKNRMHEWAGDQHISNDFLPNVHLPCCTLSDLSCHWSNILYLSQKMGWELLWRQESVLWKD